MDSLGVANIELELSPRSGDSVEFLPSSTLCSRTNMIFCGE